LKLTPRHDAKPSSATIADWHTYFVGCDEWGFSVWAHNSCIVELTDAAEIAANGGHKFKIVEGSKTISSHADRPPSQQGIPSATVFLIELTSRFEGRRAVRSPWGDSSGKVYSHHRMWKPRGFRDR
jgi:hypothetical protein